MGDFGSKSIVDIRDKSNKAKKLTWFSIDIAFGPRGEG